jgi:redox-sensitive bicupin YhaK (pirin superfamily)
VSIKQGHSVYVHVIAGEIKIDGQRLKAGDGAKINKQLKVDITSDSDNKVQALIFDLG